MAITTKTVTGKIVIPGTTIGIRANVSATPMTTANALTFPADDTISWGPVSTTTNAAGTLTPALAIPTSQAETAVMWKVIAEPIDKHPGLPKSWTLGYYQITGTGTVDLADLVEIDVTVIDPGTIVSVQQMVTDAEAARDAAQAAAAAVPGMWQASTFYTAGSVKVAPDGTTLSRIADGTSRATFDATEQAAWVSVVKKSGTIANTDLSATYASRWATGAVYAVGQPVVEPNGGAIMTVATAHTAGATFDVTKFKPAPGLPVNVRSYGCKGDWDKATSTGTDDSAAFRAACDAAYTYNRAIYIPASESGKYYCVSYWLMKGNHTLLGDGPEHSRLIKHPTISTSSIMCDIGVHGDKVIMSGFSIDGSGLGTTILGTKGVRGAVELRNLRFTNCGSTMIQVAAPYFVIDNVAFDGAGAIRGSAISIQAGARDVYIKNIRGRYLSSGIVCGTSSSLKTVQSVSVDGMDFDGGWWTSIQKASGSGAAVTYTATTLTDTAASFTTSTSVGDILRVMTPLRTATITGSDGYAVTMQDSGANFTSLGVLKGDIIRTADRIAVVRGVVSATELLIEDWQSEVDRSYIGFPSNGTAYTIYHVDRAAISSRTATTITTYGNGFRNYNAAAVTPAAGTLYEVLPLGGYQCYFAVNSTTRVDLANVRIIRSAADTIVVQGGDATVTRCTVEDGRDNGFVLGWTTGTGRLIASQLRAYHCGTGGIAVGYSSPNCILTDSISVDCVSFSTGSEVAANQGGFILDMPNGICRNNVSIPGPSIRTGANGFILGECDGLLFDGNRASGWTTDLRINSISDGVMLGAKQQTLTPVIVDSGTNTKYGPLAKTGTATLVAGAVTVADTSITANSQIRVWNKTIGGTPGALYVSAKSAGASFTITSTNAADTSVVQYEIVNY